MKKTLIALMVLAGVSAGADISADFTNPAKWDFGQAREDDKKPLFSMNDTKLTLANSNWGQQYANYDFVSETVDYYAMSQDSVLTFSAKIKPLNMSLSSIFYIETTTQAYAFGKDYDESFISYGKGGTNTVGVYNLDNGVNSASIYVGEQTRLGSTDVLAQDASVTLTATVKWVAATNSYQMNLSDGTNSKDWDLGTDKFNITKIGFYGDGANSVNNVEWSSMSFSATNVTPVAPIPEPTTATLSLLALVGLAARRRR